MKTVVVTLQGLLDLLADPAHWCQGHSATDALGNPCYFASPNAVCWCLTGGLSLVTQDSDYTAPANAIARQIVPPYMPGDIVMFNDSAITSHADVLRVVNAALKEEQQRERERNPVSGACPARQP